VGSPPLTQERIAGIRRGLLDWFAVNARDLPWRRTRDPYAILVSEVMLQQTQVDRVIPYYERFLERFPTARDLASAATAEVIRFWSGLGYNRRAVNMQRAAQAVTETLGGEFPRSLPALRQLPGVGAYTAGAIAAFAFEQDVAFLDTNMRRVVSRVVFGEEPGAGAPDASLMAAAEALVPPGEGWAWNQALIEFGALQCTARRPACIVCPLQSVCSAFPVMQTALSEKRRKRNGTPQPFAGTNRYFRGRVVEVLRTLPSGDESGIALDVLGPRVRDDFSSQDLPWLRSLVEGLQRDGLAVIAEATPPYDAAPPGPTTRVRLP
jgi:A/G-specific adenine glycosylase